MIAGTSRIRTSVAVDSNGDRQTDSDLDDHRVGEQAESQEHTDHDRRRTTDQTAAALQADCDRLADVAGLEIVLWMRLWEHDIKLSYGKITPDA
jgi:hypothetical protein